MARLTATAADIGKYMAMLDETPRRLVAATHAMKDGQLAQRPGPRQWSVAEVLAHMRACADLWGHSIYAMLAHENPILPALDERRWAKVAGYTELGYTIALQVFTLQRAELLQVLRSLAFEAWSREAMIEGRKHSVFSQVRRMALHEAEHCVQVEELLRLTHQRPDS